MTTRLTIENARRILPFLVRAAQQRETPTYQELGQTIGVHQRNVGNLLYYIKDEICAPRGLPPLTAIVIRKADRIPGEGFLPAGTTNLTAGQYQDKFDKLREEVFRYPHWDDLLRDLGLSPAAKKAGGGS